MNIKQISFSYTFNYKRILRNIMKSTITPKPSTVTISIVLLFGLFIPKVYAQTSGYSKSSALKQPYIVQRLEETITLDGWSTEASWQAIEPLPMTMYLPTWGAEPSVRTEVRIAYDDEYIYVSGRFFYSDADHIRATTRKRDNAATVNDMFLIDFDAFNNNETALTFLTTPAGTRSDAAMINDNKGSAADFFKTSWNTFWRTKSVRDERGWFVEMRIPFSSLRFEPKNGRVKMGLIIWRWMAYKKEAQLYPLISNQWGWWGQFKPSQSKTIVFKGIENDPPLYITPYVLGIFSQYHAFNDNETAYVRVDDPAFDAGLDIKYGLSNNFTLDLTVNTDFAQVEADNQQINLTRFSLFFPEKRRFFLERAGLYNFGVSGKHRLFYSRRIGLYEGQPVRILGGVRLTGRKGAWDIGLLNMQTTKTDLDNGGTLPSENFGVVRLRRSVFNSYSYVGGMMASRVGLNGSYNIAYGLDTEIRVTGDEYLQLNWAQTFINSQPSGLNAGRIHLGWARHTANGFGYEAFVTRSGKYYEPGAGFELRDNYIRLHARLSHGRLAAVDSPLLRRTAAVEADIFLRNEDGSVETMRIVPTWKYLFKNEQVIKLQGIIRYEDLREVFSLSGNTIIPTGSYTFYQLKATYDMTDSRLFDTDVTVKAGTFFDGNIASISFKPIWSISTGLKLNGFYQFNRIRFPDRNKQLNTHLARLRVLLMPSTKLTISTFMQYNSAIDLISANARLRYTPSQGNDFYLVFNQRLNTDRYSQIPMLPAYGSLSVIVKYNYTFTF